MSSLTEDSYLHCSLFDDTEAELIDIRSNQNYEPKEADMLSRAACLRLQSPESMLTCDIDRSSFQSATFTNTSAVTYKSVFHSLSITAWTPPSSRGNLCSWEQMFGLRFFFFYTLTRGVEVLFAAVSRWLVATARTSTCGTVELSKCPRTSLQSVAGKTHRLFATWSDIPRVDSVREIYVLHGRITNYSRLIKGLVHPNFEKIHLHRRLVRDGTFWRCSQW